MKLVIAYVVSGTILSDFDVHLQYNTPVIH